MHMLIYADYEFVNIGTYVYMYIAVGIGHGSSTRKYCTKISYKIV